VQPVYHRGGIGVFDDREDGDAGQEDNRMANLEPPSSSIGFGESFSAD
jgi:hypothetical protein